MRTFTITSKDCIVPLTDKQPPASQASDIESFSTLEEFQQIATQWPMSRLVLIWNNLPGFNPVTRFTDRKTGVHRIWNALQKDKRPIRNHPEPGRRLLKSLARAGSKKARVIRMMQRPNGATLQEIMRASSWQAHTVRAFISRALVRNMRLPVESLPRPQGGRAYRVKT